MNRNGAAGRQWLIAAGLALLLAAGAQARDVEVVMSDGRELEGELVNESEKEIVLLISGVRTTLARERIEQITFKKTLVEEFRARREKLNDQQYRDRYKAARWLFDQSKQLVDAVAKKKPMELALEELKALATSMGDDAPADLRESVTLLRRVVRSRLKVIESTIDQEERPDSGGPADEDGDQKNAAPDADEQPRQKEDDEETTLPPEKRLTEDQINLIRVYEIDEEIDTPIHIPRKAEEEFIAQYAGRSGIPSGRRARRRWLRAEDRQKLGVMFENRAREFYGEVEVLRDPPSMRAFRRVHQQYVLNYCATRRCHGGGGAGGLALFRQNGRQARTAYSNFLILDRYVNDDGKMIDRQRPDRSLLLRYGLRPDQTPTPHPRVDRWVARLRGPDGRRFREIVDWIETLYQPDPDYGLEWQPPAPRSGDGSAEDDSADETASSAGGGAGAETGEAKSSGNDTP